jgi:hypothetical protein
MLIQIVHLYIVHLTQFVVAGAGAGEGTKCQSLKCLYILSEKVPAARSHKGL